ncbi:Uncharacterised protein [Serratia entomophila]|nr:Uncharacterised protein [Serratia entomophila]CAI0783686.1 Uncharacterised protein [Serratia entomophila]CAI0806329.1 Uncharacterised protein [Serratia entomophila]CAI0814666.1 Uncharacterised protein [Serratia entomophila]CAI0815516.1 Uncharacterised protein [Serratia entomophila]
MYSSPTVIARSQQRCGLKDKWHTQNNWSCIKAARERIAMSLQE